MHLKVVTAFSWWVKLYTWQSCLPLVAASWTAVSTKYTSLFCRMERQDQVQGYEATLSFGKKSWFFTLQQVSFSFTSYVTRSWLSRQSWRWRLPAARGHAQRIDGTYFQSHSEISWRQIQRSWRKQREIDRNIYTRAKSPTVSRQKFGVMFKVKLLLDLLFEHQTLNLCRLEMSLWKVWTFQVFVGECFIFKDKIVSKAPKHYTVSWTAVRHITKSSIFV